MAFESKIKTIEWVDNFSRMIDQTILPYEFKTIDVKTSEEMYYAIKDMIVRGAPAIGIAGAHGVSLAAIEISKKTNDKDVFLKELEERAEYIKSSRPTAVNLMWAVDKQIKLAKESVFSVEDTVKILVQNGIKLENEDIEINKKWVIMALRLYQKVLLF